MERGSLVQVLQHSSLRNAVVTEIDGPYCEIVFTEGLESNPHWVLCAGIKQVYKAKYNQRFEEPARGMYAKIPFKSGLLWATILTVGANYTLVSYEDNTSADYIVTGSLRDCFMKATPPAVSLETGDFVHLPVGSDFGWGSILGLDGTYVHVKYENTDKKEFILQTSIVAKTSRSAGVEVKEGGGGAVTSRKKKMCLIL